MSLRITLSIPTPLVERIEERRGDETVQEYALAALRAAVHGSTAELALRAEVARLHATLRVLGGAPLSAPVAPRQESDGRKDR